MGIEFLANISSSHLLCRRYNFQFIALWNWMEFSENGIELYWIKLHWMFSIELNHYYQLLAVLKICWFLFVRQTNSSNEKIPIYWKGNCIKAFYLWGIIKGTMDYAILAYLVMSKSPKFTHQLFGFHLKSIVFG